MENSREGDIKILENFINWLKTDFEYNSGEEIKAIEHILSDYKRVLKENEKRMHDNITLKNFISALFNDSFEKDYIPVQKVKDKIEELDRKIDKSIDNSKGGLDEEFIEKAGELLTQKRILQELLEKEK